MTKLALLHPGQMGISIAASAQNSGCDVHWASQGRSPQTHARAAKHNLRDAHTLANLCGICSIIVSVCPPHAAEEVAEQVAAQSFTGLYVDANAISPQRAERIGHIITGAGATFIDGGIVGGPAWEPGRTWLYLSGPEAQAVAACFSSGPLETSVIGETIGKASALKMCYAAYTKGSTALLCAVLATAEMLGVREELQTQWSCGGLEFAPGQGDFSEQAIRRVRHVTAKAWRFAGEMDEISATFSQAGLPGSFHAAAAVIYRRIAAFKDAPSTPPLEEVLAALIRGDA